MNEIQVFKNPAFGSVRTMMMEGEPWLVGKDVAEALGYANTRDALAKHVDEEDKGVAKCDTLGGVQNLAIVNESGLYSLVMSSKLPEAKKFKRWVTSEVLPAIRKHGGYLTPDKVEEALLNPDTIIQLATQLKEERLARTAAEKKIEADAPKVLFAGAVEASQTSILLGEFAKILKQNGIDMGQKRLFDWMRKNSYLIKRKGTDYNMPTQRAMEMGLFEIKESVHLNSSGCNVVTKTPKLTGRGQLFFTNKFLGGKKDGESAKSII